MAAAVGDAAAGAAPQVAAAAGRAGGEDGGGWLSGLQSAVRTLFLMMALQNLAKTFLSPSTPSASPSASSSSSLAGSGSGSSGFYGDAHTTKGLYRGPLIPLWRKHTPMVGD